MGPVRSQQALPWYSLNPLFREQARLCVSLSRESSFFLSLAVPQFWLLSQVSSLKLSSGHSGPVLSLSTNYAAHASLSRPRSSLVAEVCVWATSPLAVVVRHVFCGVFSSPGYVAL